MTDFAHTPSSLTFPGRAEVRLILINDGALEHEPLIGRNAGDG